MKLLVLKICDNALYGAHTLRLFESWLQVPVGVGVGVGIQVPDVCVGIEVHDVLRHGVPTPEMVARSDGILIPGSVRSLSSIEPWMSTLSEFIRELIKKKKPLIGVCFGHQIIAHAIGGRVIASPHERQIGTRSFALTPEIKVYIQSLYTHICNKSLNCKLNIPDIIKLRYTHGDIVTEYPHMYEDIPVVCIGATQKCPCHGLLIGSPPFVMTLQAHPEFDTTQGKEVLAAALHNNKAKIGDTAFEAEISNIEIDDTHAYVFKDLLFCIINHNKTDI